MVLVAPDPLVPELAVDGPPVLDPVLELEPPVVEAGLDDALLLEPPPVPDEPLDDPVEEPELDAPD